MNAFYLFILIIETSSYAKADISKFEKNYNIRQVHDVENELLGNLNSHASLSNVTKCSKHKKIDLNLKKLEKIQMEEILKVNERIKKERLLLIPIVDYKRLKTEEAIVYVEKIHH